MKNQYRVTIALAQADINSSNEGMNVLVVPAHGADYDEDFSANPCEPPDCHFMGAAQGWLALGDAAAALAELAHLNPSLKNHPDVLLLSWDIHAALGQWSTALDIAGALMRVIPDDERSWLNRATTLRHVQGGGLQQAYEALLPIAEQRPGAWRTLYHLARYSCQLGRTEEAKAWLFRVGSDSGVRKMALDEPEFEPIWEFVDSADW